MAKVGRVTLRGLLLCGLACGTAIFQSGKLMADDHIGTPPAINGVDLPGSVRPGTTTRLESQKFGELSPNAGMFVVQPTAAISVSGGRLKIDGDPPSPAPELTAEEDEPDAKVAASRIAGRSTALSFSSLRMPSRMPVATSFITSGFGYRVHPILGGVHLHEGVDLAAPYGTPVFATTDGRVGMANWNGGYGLFVAVDNGAMETRYGHMSRLNVVAGQTVRKGDLIGFVGSTGRSTGPHLHYEVRLNGHSVDPLAAKSSRLAK